MLALRKIAFPAKRYFFSEAYLKPASWKSLLESKSQDSISSTDAGLTILHKIKTEEVNHAQYTNFAFKISQLNLDSMDFITNIIYKFNSSNAAQSICPQANNAIIRGLYDFGLDKEIVDLVKDKLNSGLFFDKVTANMLMKRFHENQAYDSMIDVVWELHLQNYFYQQADKSLLIDAFALTAVKGFLEAGHFQPLQVDQESETANAKKKSDQETTYVLVPYLRNPNYDGLFDVQISRVKCGDILPFLMDETKHPAINLFAWALAEKIEPLMIMLETTAEISVTQGTSDLLMKLLETCESAEETPARGFRPVTLKVDLDKAIHLTKQRVKCSDDGFDLLKTLADKVEAIVKEANFEANCLKESSDLYDSYANEDKMLTEKYSRLMKNRESLAEAKSLLRELLDKEERLTFFENQEQIKLDAWLAPRTRTEKRMSRMKKWRQDMIRYHEEKSSKTVRSNL